MARKRFGEYAVDGVGPAAVVLDDLVGDVGHLRNLASRIEPMSIAFSSEVVTGSREENASNNKGKRLAHSMTKCAAM
jgi:hypothetical protein